MRRYFPLRNQMKKIYKTKSSGMEILA